VTLESTDGFDNGKNIQIFHILSLAGVKFNDGVVHTSATGSYLEIGVELEVVSNQDVLIDYEYAGKAVSGVHYTKGDNSLVIKAGTTKGTITVALLSSPYEDGVTLDIKPVSISNGYDVNEMKSISTELPKAVLVVTNSSSDSTSTDMDVNLISSEKSFNSSPKQSVEAEFVSEVEVEEEMLEKSSAENIIYMTPDKSSSLRGNSSYAASKPIFEMNISGQGDLSTGSDYGEEGFDEF
jgi:hypothetical protein